MADIQGIRSPASSSKYKNMYKVGSPLSWKESYKKRCTDRLKGSRAKLLQRYRDMKIEEGDKVEADNDLNSSIVDDVMREEWDSMQKVENAHSDVDAVLSIMEEIKHELMLQEKEILSQYEKMEELDDTALRNIISLHTDTRHDHIICPLCHSNYIEKHLNIIKCPCGMEIDTEQDNITLNHVQVQLRVGTASHSDKCTAKPVFGVVQDFGSKNLLMSCNACDFMFVVI